MIITITFTIILLTVLALTITVVRSNIKLRNTVQPEKRLDVRVGKDVTIKIRENDEGNIRIDVEKYGERGVPTTELCSENEKEEQARELEEVGFGFSRAAAETLMNLDQYPFNERQSILQKALSDGSITQEQYSRLSEKYKDVDNPSPESAEESPSIFTVSSGESSKELVKDVPPAQEVQAVTEPSAEEAQQSEAAQTGQEEEAAEQEPEIVLYKQPSGLDSNVKMAQWMRCFGLDK